MPENATPSDPITAAIENSIAEATDIPEDTGGVDDAAEVVDAGTENAPAAEVVAEGTDKAGAVDADKPEKEVVPAAEVKKDEPKDDLEKELEALGLGKKDLQPGERENRIPYSRTRKIVGNAIKRATEKFQGQVTEATTKTQALETEIAPYRRVDELIVKDPDQYVKFLATLHPTLYGKFLKPAEAIADKAAPTTPAAADDLEPKPDHKFEDGTMGYTPDQHAKLLQWNHRQGVREAETRLRKEMDDRLGPMEAERRAREADAAQLPRVQAQKDWATKTYGEAFTADYKKGAKSEILALMKANDGLMGRPYLSFEACVAQFMVPKLQADRNAIRESVLAEINARPAAAVKGPAAAVKAVTEDNGPKTMEQVIKDSLVAAGLSK